MDLSFKAPYWERPLSDSVRQRPGLGTQPSPKSRPQALILAPKPAPVKRLDAHLFWAPSPHSHSTQSSISTPSLLPKPLWPLK